MTAAQTVILIGGSVVLTWAMIAWMSRANRRENEIIQRRYEECIAGGSNPDEKPNFYSGFGGGSGG